MKSTPTIFLSTLFFAGAAVAGAPAQQADQDHQGHDHGAAKAPTAPALVDGIIRKVDKDAGKLTIKHGPLPNGMPAMTMVFKLQNPDMLQGLESGQTIRFLPDDKLTITQIEVVR